MFSHNSFERPTDAQISSISNILKKTHESTHGQNIVLIVGHVGIGKTTTTAWLRGRELQAVREKGRVLLKTQDEEMFGNRETKKIFGDTLYAQAWPFLESEKENCDIS